MKISRTGEEETPINIGGRKIEAVTTFNYLGVMFQSNNKEDTEVRRRIGMAKQAFWQNKILLRGDLSQKLKKKILGTMIFPIVCYGSELWPETVKIRKMIDAFEHWTIRRILKISWTERITNEEVRKKLNMKNMILGPKIKERRFRCLGHILRESSGKELEELVTKEITQKTRVRGRNRKKWHDIGKMVTEITSLKTLSEEAQDRKKWKGHLKVANLHL